MIKSLLLLSLFFCSPAFAAIGAGTAWEIRVSGSSNNAGGYDSGVTSPGTDYSLQDSSQFNNTDLASTNGTTNPCVVTSASHNFVSTDNGNFIHVTAGTSWTAGVYEIISTSGNAATLDRACGSAATLSSGTWFEGGAYKLGNAFDSTFFSTSVAGNTFWLKFNASAHSSTTNNTPTTGTATVTSYVRGYNTTRGDNPTGANRPTLNQNSANFVLNFVEMRDIIYKGAAASMFQMNPGRIANMKLTNNTGNLAGRNAVNCTGNCTILNSELVSWGGQALNVASGAQAHVTGSYLHDSNVCVNLAAGTSSVIVITNSILAHCQAQAVNIVSAVFNPSFIVNNTIYGEETPVTSSTGIKTITGSSLVHVLNNIIYGWATGMANPDAKSGNFNDYNNFNNNTADITTWGKGPNSVALAPSFSNMTNVHGTGASTSGQVLTDGSANFSSVTDSTDTLCIVSSTGGSVGCYLITAHTSTTVTADSTIGALGTGSSVVYNVNLGHNFAPGTNMKAAALPLASTTTTSYLDIGGVQRLEDYPAIGNVRSGTVYGNSSLTGTMSSGSGGGSAVFVH